MEIFLEQMKQALAPPARHEFLQFHELSIFHRPFAAVNFRKDSFGKLAFDYPIKTNMKKASPKARATRGGAARGGSRSSALLENVTEDT